MEKILSGEDIKQNAIPAVSKEPYAKYVLGMDYTFETGLYIQAQYLHGFTTERGANELHDYLIGVIEKKFLNDEFTENRFMDGFGKFVFNNKIPILLVAAVLVVISAVTIPNIKKSVDWSLCLQKGSKAHMAEMVLRRDFGGTVLFSKWVRRSAVSAPKLGNG